MSELEQVARVLTGEASIFGYPGMLAVAFTIACRLDAGYEDLPQVLGAYFGDQEPTPMAWHMAHIVVNRPAYVRELWLQRTGDSRWFFFVMSQEDIEALGWPPGLRQYQAVRGPYRLHLYTEWRN